MSSVYGIHLFADHRHGSLRKGWEENIRSVTKANSPDVSVKVKVKYRFIRLSLATILDTNGLAYVKEMRRFRKQLEDDFGSSLVKYGGDSVSKFAGKLFGAKSQFFTRYMFIADELAAWMVRDLMFRQPELCHHTVAVVFQGIPIPASTGTGTEATSVTNFDRSNALEGYLTNLASLFGGKGDKNGPLMIGWNEDDSDLLTRLENIDQTFAKLPHLACIEPISWATTTLYDHSNNNISLKNPKLIQNDLWTLIKAASQLVQAEAKTKDHNVIVDNRRDSRDRININKWLSVATRPYMLPVVSTKTVRPQFQSQQGVVD
jgi:hypothetical protein